MKAVKITIAALIGITLTGCDKPMTPEQQAAAEKEQAHADRVESLIGWARDLCSYGYASDAKAAKDSDAENTNTVAHAAERTARHLILNTEPDPHDVKLIIEVSREYAPVSLLKTTEPGEVMTRLIYGCAKPETVKEMKPITELVVQHEAK